MGYRLLRPARALGVRLRSIRAAGPKVSGIGRTSLRAVLELCHGIDRTEHLSQGGRMSRLRNWRCLLVGVWLVAGPAVGAEDSRFPAPGWVGDEDSLGRGVQRTMRVLVSSSPEHHPTVKILFYGQSITEQAWWREVADDLRRRFPHADLQIENQAIGGHSSQRLVKTAEADLAWWYPDLVIFHVYGSHIDYAKILRGIREQTTAEILIQNDHVTKARALTEETDPAALTPSNWDPFMNHKFLPSMARTYATGFVDQRQGWKRYLAEHNLNPPDLLKDGVHLNEHGCFLMAELVKPHLHLNPDLDGSDAADWIRTVRVGHDVVWRERRLVLEFDGNRVDAVVEPDAGDHAGVEVWIDGRRPSAIPALRTFTRVSPFPRSNWPCLLRVQSDAPLELEDWTLTLLETSDDLATVRFRLEGSKTGPDGQGVSTERFVSDSGRIVLEPEDWNLAYCRDVFKRGLDPGYTIQWSVRALFRDKVERASVPASDRETVRTLAQGLPPGPHRLELRSASAGGVTALHVYRPPGSGLVRHVEEP